MAASTARTVKDVNPHEFVKAYSAHLKRSGKVPLPDSLPLSHLIRRYVVWSRAAAVSGDELVCHCIGLPSPSLAVSREVSRGYIGSITALAIPVNSSRVWLQSRWTRT